MSLSICYCGTSCKNLSKYCPVQAWKEHSDVIYIRPLVAVGEKVRSSADGLPTWLYEMMVTRPTVDEAIDFVKSIELKVEPNIVIE